jgi:hypothetical protein
MSCTKTRCRSDTHGASKASDDHNKPMQIWSQDSNAEKRNFGGQEGASAGDEMVVMTRCGRWPGRANDAVAGTGNRLITMRNGRRYFSENAALQAAETVAGQ